MRTINDLVFDLKIESPPEAFDEIADYVHEAFCVAREFSRALPITGCKIHPQGAVDPDSPPEWGNCLLCNIRRRRERDAQRSGWRRWIPMGSMRRPFLP